MRKKTKFCSHPVDSCCIFPLPSKGRLKIHVFTIATLPINMEFKTQYYRNIRQKYTPLKMQMNWNKLMVSEIAWLWVGQEKEFWRFLNLDSLLDFCFEGGFILYGKCFMVFGSVWSVSWSSPWGKKNIQKPNPDKSWGMTQVLLYLLLAMKSELTAGSSGSASALMIS